MTVNPPIPSDAALTADNAPGAFNFSSDFTYHGNLGAGPAVISIVYTILDSNLLGLFSKNQDAVKTALRDPELYARASPFLDHAYDGFGITFPDGVDTSGLPKSAGPAGPSPGP
jgi:hypothetical protein